MSRKFNSMVVAAAVLMSPLAWAQQQTKAQCEAECDETGKICEETVAKKIGKDNKAALQQVKKGCADAVKTCKGDCK